MLYQKNLPVWERWLRVLGGVALVAYGLLAAPSLLIAVLAYVSAAVVIITGFVGYCPACALVGRKPIEPANTQPELRSKSH